MLLTDEHSIRTLGCYRDLLFDEQKHVWGDGIEVETPNIDRLAKEGAIFSNFYTVVPLCTPSRASFMSGLYPAKTGGSDLNHGRMDDHITTFAEVLKTQRDYHTGYFGKWHLNGDEKPGFGNDERKFGFTDTKYQFNRGHWKFMDEVNGEMQAFEFDKETKFNSRQDKHYMTDYLFDRGIEFMEKAKSLDQPFAYVLSIPDPHAPNEVRQPYEDMYKDMHFELPRTAKMAVRKNPAAPVWNYHEHLNVKLDDADKYLRNYENNIKYQNHMQQYFGMVKCIDDNVGKLLDYLTNEGIDQETIVV
jgi:arylsulfatase A-like enzyme